MKNMKLSANEALMLLALNDDDGKVRWSASPYLDHALAGAILVELQELSLITVENGRVTPARDAVSPKSMLLSEAYHVLAKHGAKGLEINKAIGILLELTDLTQRQMEELVERGILGRHEEHFLLIFSAQTYPTVDARPERLLIRRMREICLHEADGDHRLRAVVALAYTAHLLRGPLNAQQLEQAMPKLLTFVAENPIVSVTNELVRRSEQALYMATTSSFGGVPQV